MSEVAEKIDTPEPKPAPQERTLPRGAKLHQGRIRPYDHRVRKYWLEVPYGLEPEDVEVPAFFTHVTKQFRPGDEIVAFAEDSSWECAYRVLWVGQTDMRISRITNVIRHEGTDIPVASDDYEIIWKGPAMQFAIVQKDGGEIVKDHLYPKEKALQALREYAGRVKG
jgi:hypothetical protein